MEFYEAILTSAMDTLEAAYHDVKSEAVAENIRHEITKIKISISPEMKRPRELLAAATDGVKS